MNKQEIIKNIIIFILIVATLSTQVWAIPPLPTEFYGEGHYFNNDLSVGTQIKAYDPEGNLCGSFSVTTTGYYGSLTCAGKDTTGTGDGPDEGDSITFRIGTSLASALTGNTATSIITPTYTAGEFKQINLVAPPLVCGDNFCDIYESCSACSEDCGVCPTGDDGTGGTGGTGGGGSTQPPSSSESTTEPQPAIQLPALPEEICEESWSCSDWGECYPNGVQTRECTDLNECGTVEIRPPLRQDCIYINDSDISEPEVQTPTTVRPKTPAQILIQPCTEKMNVFSIPSMIFIFLFLLILSISLGKLHKQVKKIRKDKSLKDIERLEKEFHLKKESYIFIISMSVIGIIVYFYHYFFFMCKDNYVNHLWLLAAFIIISPIIINFVIEIMKYREDEKLAKLALLHDTHYQHFEKLLDITNGKIYELFGLIITNSDLLQEKDDLHKLLLSSLIFRKIYKEIHKLHKIYQTGKDSISKEKDFILDIKEAMKDEDFVLLIAKNEHANSLNEDFKLLLSTFATKQEILDELHKIEEEYADLDDMSNITKTSEGFSGKSKSKEELEKVDESSSEDKKDEKKSKSS